MTDDTTETDRVDPNDPRTGRSGGDVAQLAGRQRGENLKTTGRIEGIIEAVAALGEREGGVDRFAEARRQEWPVVWSRATSAAHTWQIEEIDGARTLAEQADPSDLSTILFGTGWLYDGPASLRPTADNEGLWIKVDEGVIERVESLLDRRETLWQERQELVDEWLADRPDVRWAVHNYRQSDQWLWHRDTELEARPHRMRAFIDGWDAAMEAEGESTDVHETVDDDD